MNIGQIEENLSNLINNFSEETFIYELLLAYGIPKTTITLLKKGKRNLAKNDDQIVLKKKLFFQEVRDQDIHAVIDSLYNNDDTSRHNPRFIVVTDYKTLLAIDTKVRDTLDIDIKAINKHFDFFLPWAGIEKTQHKSENPADVKAAEKMAKIYDEILEVNQFTTQADLHGLNIFLSRLLFCFFAEDTDIFRKGSFTNSISSHTQADGSDLHEYLNRFFEVLNTQDRSIYPEYLKTFPYVNGGLFGDKYYAPKFSSKSRRMIIECGKLNWSAINPDIFGSMIQAVVHPDERGVMGMHYTSVPNIMKVIEPLFLNELKEEFEKSYENANKLKQLLTRLERIRIFDPACGSGNFLIIAYKEIRKLEMEIFQRLRDVEVQMKLPFSCISLSQFYGIELDDFAHEIAILSLWLAEHQMHVKFKEVFGHANPTLPLKEGGKVVHGNAARLDWEHVCPKNGDAEIYILGNPPYLGARNQDRNHKEDLSLVFEEHEDHKDADYVCCWFLKGAKYVQGANAMCAFVSTNSICQGEQASHLWSRIIKNEIEIGFAYQSFKWSNNAKGNAGVTCIIVGLRNQSKNKKILYRDSSYKVVNNINGYLADAANLLIRKEKISISKMPKMVIGNMARDGGNLILSTEEKNKIVDKFPEAKSLIRKLFGSHEFISGQDRWCLWIEDEQLSIARSIPEIDNRINKVYDFRISSKAKTTNTYAAIPHKFAQRCLKETSTIIVPSTSSERREYIPIGFLDAGVVVTNSANAIYDAQPYVFGLLTSMLHNIWVRSVGGKLETRIRYSTEICYNTFPVPDLTDKQKEMITTHVYNVLEEREKHPERTMAELYDPDKMPKSLHEAHHNLNLAVELCYRSKPFTSDEERLEYLFKLYEDMVSKLESGDSLPILVKKKNYKK